MDTSELRAIETKLAAIEARQDAKFESIAHDLEQLKDGQEHLDKGQREIVAQLNRWRGAWPAITILAGLLAFAITQWDSIRAAIVGH